jgi:membrane associated rhomboid family serine protease
MARLVQPAAPPSRAARPAGPLPHESHPAGSDLPPMARLVEPRMARVIPTRPCPCCAAPVAADATVCTACGTDLETGRRLIQQLHWDREKEREQLLDSWLKWATIWIPFGFVPYRSEVPLRQRPTALLLIVLLNFLSFPIGLTDWGMRHGALWAGDPNIPHPPVLDERGKPIDFQPPVSRFAWYQLLTHQFMHGDSMHIAFNMAVLLVFGPKVNDVLGNARFVAWYLGLGSVAGMAHLLQFRHQPAVPAVGASGCAMVVSAMYLVFCPQHRIRLAAWLRLFLFTPLWLWPFRVRGVWVVVTSVAMDLISVALGSDDHVAHGVHIIGFVSGLSVAAMLLAMRRVQCGGYDLLTWCFGREVIDREEPGTVSDRWTTILNHPLFLGAVLFAAAASFVVRLIMAILADSSY